MEKLSDLGKLKKDPLARALIRAALLAVAAVVVFRFVLGVGACRGNSMYPALKDGDLIIFSRLGLPSQGDIAVCKKTSGSGASFFRVAATEGMEVDITGNGEFTTNGYAELGTAETTREKEGSDISFPLTVGEGQLFLLNDNRSENEDSRAFGSVSKREIIGKVVFVLRRRGF